MLPSDNHAASVKPYTYYVAPTYFSSLIFYSSLPSTTPCTSVSLTYTQVSRTLTHTEVHKLFLKHTSQFLCLLMSQVLRLLITILTTLQESSHSAIAFAYLLIYLTHSTPPTEHHKNL